MAFVTLVEQGRGALGDPVSRSIPAWKPFGVAVAGSRKHNRMVCRGARLKVSLMA
ncbi:hypothetical protein [Ralstonia sp. ASV6]|uniref:hypothetical protein n=1 Tax=Ralstonia sp. ASV6 TaxID=2795124 RepID=UPI0018EADC23|nr:hypothetical protein [Ralstonia sp. ASV6]